MEGIVFNIQRYAVHDGPGIRTLIFLKGCPLRCLWCCNPESQVLFPQLLYDRSKCIGCKACAEVCPVKATIVSEDGSIKIDRNKCTACGECISVCPVEARKLIGKKMTVEQVAEEVNKDKPFYRRSGGGVTLSGGEPLLQLEFIKAILSRLKQDCIHTALETSTYAPWEHIEQIISLIDLWMMDIKHMDSEKHKELTGVKNDLILKNAIRISKRGMPMRIRIPVIPGFNDDYQNLINTAEFIKGLDSVERVDILPYHNLGVKKYAQLGATYKLDFVEKPSDQRMQRVKEILEDKGLIVKIGGAD